MAPEPKMAPEEGKASTVLATTTTEEDDEEKALPEKEEAVSNLDDFDFESFFDLTSSDEEATTLSDSTMMTLLFLGRRDIEAWAVDARDVA